MGTSTIHPSAIIDSQAELGDEVEVGEYCVIKGKVHLGDRCQLLNHVTIYGPTTIGKDNRFYSFASIGQRSQDLKYTGEPTFLTIGDGNCFREFVTVHRATEPDNCTRIGNGGNFLAYSHIAHDCVVGNCVIFSNNGTLAGHVTVDDGAIIGGLSAVHQFCRIGRFAMTGGCTKVVKDVPPFMIADGNPAEIRSINSVGMERNHFPAETIREVKEAFRLIYRSGLNTNQALEQIRAQLPNSNEIKQISPIQCV